ncbi:MAG: spore coat associated protein CotJA [Clostridia bacterium]|nr:spore coat associated protein CotJA [Clostridia bacterium]
MATNRITDYQPGPGPIGRPPQMRLARAYVPWQRYGRTFSPREALMKGTLFPDLYFPYRPYS